METHTQNVRFFLKETWLSGGNQEGFPKKHKLRIKVLKKHISWAKMGHKGRERKCSKQSKQYLQG